MDPNNPSQLCQATIDMFVVPSEATGFAGFSRVRSPVSRFTTSLISLSVVERSRHDVLSNRHCDTSTMTSRFKGVLPLQRNGTRTLDTP